jgi:RNA recognition motif-containing protein
MNIYIGNLSYNVRENDLQRVLQEYGAVASVRIIMDRNTGRSKGFGFCEMESDEDARKAIEKLNGTELSGRTLIVKEALPKN